MTIASVERTQSPPASAQKFELDFTLTEVKHLWSFLDGSIMNVDVRQHLWRSWGFCPRHTWAHAVADAAMRASLHGTSILYEDLISRAAATMPARPRASTVQRRLRARDSCFTCGYLKIASTEGDRNFAWRARNVNRRERFSAWLLAAEHVWRERMCPVCIGGDGPVCRPHLLADATDVPDGLKSKLTDIGRRLDVFAQSWRWHGPVPNDEEQSSWVEALGWFGGWHYPIAAAAHHRSTGRREGGTA